MFGMSVTFEKNKRWKRKFYWRIKKDKLLSDKSTVLTNPVCFSVFAKRVAFDFFEKDKLFRFVFRVWENFKDRSKQQTFSSAKRTYFNRV